MEGANYVRADGAANADPWCGCRCGSGLELELNSSGYIVVGEYTVD